MGGKQWGVKGGRGKEEGKTESLYLQTCIMENYNIKKRKKQTKEQYIYIYTPSDSVLISRGVILQDSGISRAVVGGGKAEITTHLFDQPMPARLPY